MAADQRQQSADKPPRIRQIIADNVTPESAQQILNDQGGSLAIISPEPAFLTNIAGRYSDGNPDLDVYLKGHAADPIRSNRITRDEDDVPRACLTLCISPQPDVVEKMGAVPGWIERAGAARLLPAFPDASIVGYRNLHPAPVPADLRQAWADLVVRCLKLKQRAGKRTDGKPAAPEPHTLVLASEALPDWEAFRAWREREMRPGGAFAGTGIDAWADKLEGAVLRLAGLLHIAGTAVPQDAAIPAETLRAAITLARYFHEHARVMYAMSGAGTPGRALALLEALRSIRQPHTTKRELFHKVRGQTAFQTVDSLDAPLKTLEEYGWIGRERQTGPKGGRPSEQIDVHPDLHAQSAQNPGSDSNGGGFGGIAHASEPPNVTRLDLTGTEGWVEV